MQEAIMSNLVGINENLSHIAICLSKDDGVIPVLGHIADELYEIRLHLTKEKPAVQGELLETIRDAEPYKIHQIQVALDLVDRSLTSPEQKEKLRNKLIEKLEKAIDEL